MMTVLAPRMERHESGIHDRDRDACLLLSAGQTPGRRAETVDVNGPRRRRTFLIVRDPPAPPPDLQTKLILRILKFC